MSFFSRVSRRSGKAQSEGLAFGDGAVMRRAGPGAALDANKPKGMHSHHIAEQNKAAQFGQRRIQSIENSVAIPIEAHHEFGMEQFKRVLGH